MNIIHCAYYSWMAVNCGYSVVCFLLQLVVQNVVISNMYVMMFWDTASKARFPLEYIYIVETGLKLCMRDVTAVSGWWWRGQCPARRLWIIPSALCSWWQDHCRWGLWHFASLCFVRLLLLRSRLCISYAWNILGAEVQSSITLQYLHVCVLWIWS